MPNAADQARLMAHSFAQISEAVDAYRTAHFAELAPDAQARLEQLIQQLDDVHDSFTALAIEDTLRSIQDDLDQIATVTTQAQKSLRHLTAIGDIIKLVSAVAQLGEDIATGDYGAIPQAVKDLVQALPPNIR